MVPSIFLINLDRDAHRLLAMSQQLEKLRLPFERVAAIFGTRMPDWLRPYFLDSQGKIASDLTPGEVGCYASHLLLMSRAAAGDRPVIVLEDDLLLHAHFPDVLAAAGDLPQDLDMLKLTRMGGRTPIPVRRLASGHAICKYTRTPLGTGAYLITPAGARKFLDWKTLRTTPIDQDLRRPWDCRMNIYGFDPIPAEQNIGTSTIESLAPLPVRRIFHQNHPLVERMLRYRHEVRWIGWRHRLLP